ncbi:MAG TPA: hypothetical protein VNY10_20535, partial [Roseiarcus sp.]|nr:hypothetical protein [Roseiarcus sp.]
TKPLKEYNLSVNTASNVDRNRLGIAVNTENTDDGLSIRSAICLVKRGLAIFSWSRILNNAQTPPQKVKHDANGKYENIEPLNYTTLPGYSG